MRWPKFARTHFNFALGPSGASSLESCRIRMSMRIYSSQCKEYFVSRWFWPRGKNFVSGGRVVHCSRRIVALQQHGQFTSKIKFNWHIWNWENYKFGMLIAHVHSIFSRGLRSQPFRFHNNNGGKCDVRRVTNSNCHRRKTIRSTTATEEAYDDDEANDDERCRWNGMEWNGNLLYA